MSLKRRKCFTKPLIFEQIDLVKYVFTYLHFTEILKICSINKMTYEISQDKNTYQPLQLTLHSGNLIGRKLSQIEWRNSKKQNRENNEIFLERRYACFMQVKSLFEIPKNRQNLVQKLIQSVDLFHISANDERIQKLKFPNLKRITCYIGSTHTPISWIQQCEIWKTSENVQIILKNYTFLKLKILVLVRETSSLKNTKANQFPELCVLDAKNLENIDIFENLKLLVIRSNAINVNNLPKIIPNITIIFFFFTDIQNAEELIYRCINLKKIYFRKNQNFRLPISYFQQKNIELIELPNEYTELMNILTDLEIEIANISHELTLSKFDLL